MLIHRDLNRIKSGADRLMRAVTEAESELLDLCAEFHILAAEADGLPIDAIEEFCRSLRVQRALHEVVRTAPALTPQGARAKAGVVMASARLFSWEP